MKNKKLYFLGIGGIGMSALAQYFLSERCEVYGYDRTPSPITDMLSARGARIHFEDHECHIPAGIDAVIYTPAVPRENREFRHFVRQGTPMFKRSQMLGRITEQMPAIAVAGTHGKTTTTAMVAHALAPELPILAFIGGIAKNFNDNLVLAPKPVLAVAEADEYDRSFLTLHPSVGIITSMDADHLDIYGTRENLIDAFRQFAAQSQRLVIEASIAGLVEHPRKRTYGTTPEADYYIHNIAMAPNLATFDLRTPTQNLCGLQLRANGLYNVLNATATLAALEMEADGNDTVRALLSPEHIAKKLLSFSGVKRRFEYIIDRDDFIYIDDYAHHPEEMRSFITAVQKIYPGRHICAIFQPHLFTRTHDFATQFAEVLSLLPEVILLPIYPAREAPIPGVTSEALLAHITSPRKLVLQKEEVLPYLQRHTPHILLTIGAGDIDRLVPEIMAIRG